MSFVYGQYGQYVPVTYFVQEIAKISWFLLDIAKKQWIVEGKGRKGTERYLDKIVQVRTYFA